MSTRAAIHFEYIQTEAYDEKTGKRTTLPEPIVHTEAIIYRHSDGYPEGLGADLARFIAEVRTLKDQRLGDPSYLPAKWVVFDVLEQQVWRIASNARAQAEGREPYYGEGRLEFLGVGIVDKDPSDIEYRYHVVCDGHVDEIRWEQVDTAWGDRPEEIHETGVIDTRAEVTA